jgi:DNA-directed RNA polymerase sigma subunit (sigma70/sigma32)
MLVGMGKSIDTPAHVALMAQLKDVRAPAIEHARQAHKLARVRRRIMDQLLAEGFSQADLARELGVTRQAVQKMMAIGQPDSRS